MITFNFNKTKMLYDATTCTFTISEKHLRFATTYTMINPETKNSMVFELSHSTGPEFDPKTQWVYQDATKKYTLIVCNDAAMTKVAEKNYFEAKTKQEKFERRQK